jgi:hypothetical protein
MRTFRTICVLLTLAVAIHGQCAAACLGQDYSAKAPEKCHKHSTDGQPQQDHHKSSDHTASVCGAGAEFKPILLHATFGAPAAVVIPSVAYLTEPLPAVTPPPGSALAPPTILRI